MKNKNKALEEKLNMLNQTRPRESMGRPCYFKDKTKYDRNSYKSELKRGVC